MAAARSRSARKSRWPSRRASRCGRAFHIKLIYELAEPNIWALDTQDEDMTDDEEDRLGDVAGGEAQPRDDWLLGGSQASQSL